MDFVGAHATEKVLAPIECPIHPGDHVFLELNQHVKSPVHDAEFRVYVKTASSAPVTVTTKRAELYLRRDTSGMVDSKGFQCRKG